MRRNLMTTFLALASCAATGPSVQANGNADPPPTGGTHATGEAHVTVTFGARVEAKFGGPIDLEIQLRNDGGATATVPAPHGQWLTPEIVGPNGQAVACHKRPQNFMPVLKKLEPGQTLPGKVDLSGWCTFPGPGEYRGTIHYETHGETMTSVSGTGTVVIVLTAG